MGASTWNYFTPFDADAEVALQRLRQQVFANKEYGTGVPKADELRAWFEETVGRHPNPALARQQMEESLAHLKELESEIPPDPPVETIEELLEYRAEDGTHSILDILCTSAEPEFGSVCPMPPEELQGIFGTEQPTRKLVEEKLGTEELFEHPLVSERWQGVYFVVYLDGQPNELFFIGTSGD